MSLVLTDHHGQKIARFGAAGVKRTLMDPTQTTIDHEYNDFASVWCEASQVYLLRIGKSTRSYELTLIYWDSVDSDSPIEEHFEASNRDKAIAKFLRLCKREPLYAPT